ncbi:MAG: protein-glutamate O-methyltransferase CheR [Planctomycetota bacterium]
MTLRPIDFQFLAGFVRDRAGIVLEEGKQYLLEARLAPLIRESGLADIGVLCERLRAPGAVALKARVVEAMTTNETSFFRDSSPFEILKNEVLPDLIDKRAASRKLSIWSAACSSGQEPYSLAIVLRDAFPQLSTWDVQITATDLSEQMVARCKAGVFSDYELSRGMSPVLRDRHFSRQGEAWQAREDLRRLIQARQLNLLQPLPLDFRFDLVLIRNVLIYFDEPTKEAILRRVQNVLAKDGYLMLGTAETPRGDGFTRSASGRTMLYRPAA